MYIFTKEEEGEESTNRVMKREGGRESDNQCSPVCLFVYLFLFMVVDVVEDWLLTTEVEDIVLYVELNVRGEIELLLVVNEQRYWR